MSRYFVVDLWLFVIIAHSDNMQQLRKVLSMHAFVRSSNILWVFFCNFRFIAFFCSSFVFSNSFGLFRAVRARGELAVRVRDVVETDFESTMSNAVHLKIESSAQKSKYAQSEFRSNWI